MAKVVTVWTDCELENVRYALRRKYRDLPDGTLLKYAVRELIEGDRLRRNQEKNQRERR